MIAKGPFQLFYNSIKYALVEVLSHGKISEVFIWDLQNPLLQLGKRKVFPIRAQVPDTHRTEKFNSRYASISYRALLASGRVPGIRPLLPPPTLQKQSSAMEN